MKIAQARLGPDGYLFNTALAAADPAVFDLPSVDTQAASAAGRAAVRFAMLDQLPVVIKRYHRGGMVRHLTADLYWFQGYERSRSWREIRLLAHMHGLGLPVPAPVAGSVNRVASGWYRAGLITGRIESSTSLGDWLVHSALTKKQWQALGATIRRFHDAGIFHADLNAHNILFDASERFHLIDFDRGRIVKASSTDNWRQANLDRLHRSLQKLQRASATYHFDHDDWRAVESAAVRHCA